MDIEAFKQVIKEQPPARNLSATVKKGSLYRVQNVAN
jgi:hypothetical protein